MKISILVGSLRAESYNLKVGKHILQYLLKNHDIEIIDINLPLYNADLSDNKPNSVEVFLKKMVDSDAYIFVTPEYNHSFSGVIKNAIDWASREPIFNEKPAFVTGATPGFLGTVRAQEALKIVLNTFSMCVLPGNEVFIGGANKLFDSNDMLMNVQTQQFLESALDNFIQWSEVTTKVQ